MKFTLTFQDHFRFLLELISGGFDELARVEAIRLVRIARKVSSD